MSLAPFLRSPLTDFTGSLISHQVFGVCGPMEMAAMDCLEAYGVVRGQTKCADVLDDFYECQSHTKQMKRFVAMFKERERQIKEGKLKGDEKYEPTPKLGSF